MSKTRIDLEEFVDEFNWTLPRHGGNTEIAAVHRLLATQPDSAFLAEVLGLIEPASPPPLPDRAWCAIHDREKVRRSGKGQGWRCSPCDSAKQKERNARKAAA